MINWAERAKIAISQSRLGSTAETDDKSASNLLAVLSVTSPSKLSTVLAVATPNALQKNNASVLSEQDSDAWRPLYRVYDMHQHTCSQCRAAGIGYGLRCAAGAAFWAGYQNH